MAVVQESRTPGLIGARVKQIESPRLLAGRGEYLDDITLTRMLEGAVLRSPYPHAQIKSIDVSRALAMPGVFDVITGADLVKVAEPQPVIYYLTPDQRATNAYALATDRVRWVGQAVAAVAAVDRYVAEDALAAIDVEYEPLPTVPDLDAALAPGAPRLYDDWPDNVVGTTTFDFGDTEAAFAAADTIVTHRFNIGRMSALPLEPRGVIASWDPFSDQLDMWMSSQSPNLARDLLADTLRIPEHKIRVRVPDLGGGFGLKFDFYGEFILAAVLSRRTGRPIKLNEDRVESFVASAQSREAVIEASMAATADGTITAVKGTVYGVLGGALSTVGQGPNWLTATFLTGAYKIPNQTVHLKTVLTNKAPMGSFRGWGQPEACFVVERLIDLVAKELDLDSNEVRRRNFVDEFPYYTGTVHYYDSGNYAATMDQCVDEVVRQGWPELRAKAQAEGRAVGIGYAFHVEITTFGPSRIFNTVGLTHSCFDEEVIRMDTTGRISVLTGQIGMGQGIQTALAQIAAEKMGVPLDYVTVITGDTATCPFTGYGTGASRAASMGGAALMKASEKLREKILRIAAHMLEAAPEDLEIVDGNVFVRGTPSRAVTYADIGDASYRRLAGKLPEGEDPTLEERYVFDPTNVAFSYGHTAVLAEVDRETGHTKLLGYIVSHDCGTVINPTTVDGQLHGGAAQGIAQALYEELVYDDEGRLITNSLLDYPVPTASEIPPFTTLHLETPAPHIPGGMKGMGEAGTIGAPPAVVNAIEDALSGRVATITQIPITPPRLLARIRAAQATEEGAAR